MSNLAPLPENLRVEIRKSNLKYLWNLTEARPYTLLSEQNVQVHGSVGKDGTLIECLMGSAKLPVGWNGWVHEEKIIHYSKYIAVDDMELPAPGSDVFHVGSYFSFLTLVERAGKMVLAETIRQVTFDTPRKIGTTPKR